MKKCVLILTIVLLFLCACGRQEAVPVVVSAPPTIAARETLPANRTVRVAVSELLAQSALLSRIQTRFEQETDYKLEFAPAANSTVVSVGQSGKADVLLVQQGTAASQFIAAGYGTREIPFLTDSLVLAGPADDPAQVGSAQDISQAMIRIATSGATFVSRYDDSDVYRAETRLWADAGIIIGNGRDWYTAARLGAAGTLQTAQEKGAYTVAQREAFLREKTDLRIFMQDVPGLQNTYCVIPVSVGQFESVNADGAEAFVEWLTGDGTKSWIGDFGTEDFGRPLFNMTNTMEG